MAPLLSVKLSLYWYVKSQKSQKCCVVSHALTATFICWHVFYIPHSLCSSTSLISSFLFFFFLDKSLGSFTLLRVIFAAMVIGDFGWSHDPTYRCIHVRYLVTTRTHVWVCFVPNYNFHVVGDQYCKTPHCACNLQASVRYAQTQSFRFDRAFRIERQWWAS